MYLFLTIVLTISGLVHWFLYGRLVSALEITSPAVLWVLRGAAILLAVFYILSRSLERTLPAGLVHAFDWTASMWLGIMWQLLWMGLVLYLIKVILMVTGAWGALGGETQTLIGRYIFFTVIATTTILSSFGWIKAAGPARIVEVDVPVQNFTPELGDLKIAVVADFHASTVMHERRVQKYCEQITALKPDLILIPGDIIDTPAHIIRTMSSAFRKLSAPLGVFSSTGNHEYYVGLQGAVKLIEDGGIRMLMNDSAELPNGLVIAGIEDRTARQMGRPCPAPAELLKGRSNPQVKILLNHTPAANDMRTAIDGGADLVVSGHTHGGQIWPFSLLTRWAFPLHHGLYPVGEGHVLTTCGIGTWGPPMRLGAPPEIMIVRLIPPDEAAEVRWE